MVRIIHVFSVFVTHDYLVSRGLPVSVFIFMSLLIACGVFLGLVRSKKQPTSVSSKMVSAPFLRLFFAQWILHQCCGVLAVVMRASLGICAHWHVSAAMCCALAVLPFLILVYPLFSFLLWGLFPAHDWRQQWVDARISTCRLPCRLKTMWPIKVSLSIVFLSVH